MILKTHEMFTGKTFPCVTDAKTGKKIYTESHVEFQERLRKTLYYGKYTDGSLPSPTVTDVAVKLINSKTSRRKPLDKYQAIKMTRRARISPCALMMGILYTERLAQSNPAYLKKVSSPDLFMVSMLVASKYLYDDGEEEDAYNYDWSKAGNYHICDLNRLEREFLVSIGWRIFVGYKEFFEFVNKIEARVALDTGTERGWYTYMDIKIFLENLIFQDLLKKYVENTGKVILGCAIAYSVSVAVLLCSSALIANCLDKRNVCSTGNELVIIPQMSFMGNLGHCEHALVASQSVRKRQIGYNDSLEMTETNFTHFHILEENQTKKITDSCPHYGNLLDNSYKHKTYPVSTIVKPTRRKCHFWDPCMRDALFNRTGRDGHIDIGLNNVLSFVTLSFNHSWYYGSVKFPVWENSYSGILIGFSTSAAALSL